MDAEYAEQLSNLIVRLMLCDGEDAIQDLIFRVLSIEEAKTVKEVVDQYHYVLANVKTIGKNKIDRLMNADQQTAATEVHDYSIRAQGGT